MLLCWDGSESAERAISQAARVLGRDRPGVVLFVYLPTESAGGVLSGRPRPDAAVMNPSDADTLLARGVAVAEAAGLTAEGMLVAADRTTARTIADAAEARDAPLIVMGQRERSPLGTLVLGSVARDVLAAQHRPVLLIGPQ